MARQNQAKTQPPEFTAQPTAAAGAFSSQAASSGPAVLALQRAAGNRAVGQLLQTKLANGQENAPAEAEADRAANEATRAPEQPEREARTRPLIVEDDAERLQPGQMRKSDFLDELKTSVCGAAEEALAGTMWSAMGCPYIDRWFSHYSGQSGQHVERALRKYAPETAGASDARGYIPIITQRLRRGIEQWKETGEVSGVPEEMAQGGMPGVTAAGLMGGLAPGAVSAAGAAVSGLMSGAGRAMSGMGRMLFKGREGGARESEDPAAIQAQLGSGHSLGGGVKARMEEAYGVSFSGVRVHTDAKARELSGDLNARAFTVGNDIAFGTGEYQPGTLIGDALIAHELAHVIQQGSGSGATASQSKGSAEYGSLEEEADVSAVGAMVSAWGGVKDGLKALDINAMPRLKSGLRLQGCNIFSSSDEKDVAKDAGPAKDAGAATSAPVTPAKTKGEEMTEKAEPWLSAEANVKAEVDVLTAALREIKKGKSVDFNKDAGVKRIGNVATILGLAAGTKTKLEGDWKWLVDNRKSSGTKAYQAREGTFFDDVQSPIKKLGSSFPKSQTKYWLKNTPSQVADLIIQVADVEMPADQLFAYAAKEGLIDRYVRPQMGLSPTDEPTKEQLKSVSTSKSISGFVALGLDDIVTDLTAKREPLTGFLPPGFDRSKATEVTKTNEMGREVKSMDFPNLLMALQALLAMLKRRRKLFVEDAKANGYKTPTTDELVYWTYIYFNSGEFGGKAQLEKYKGKRVLSDWIKSGEYENAIKLLQSYQMLKTMKLF